MNNALLISTRHREVWTYEDKRLLDRVAKMVTAHGDRFLLICGADLCPEPRLQLVQDDTNPSGRILECGCTRRYFLSRISH